MRALLIDGHILFRQGLKFLLSELDENMEFFEADNCEQALACKQNVGLVLLDLYVPGANGLDALSTVRKNFDSSIIVALSREDNLQVIRRAVENGASSFILKSSAPRILRAALQAVLAGEAYLPPHALRDPAIADQATAGGAGFKSADRKYIDTTIGQTS